MNLLPASKRKTKTRRSRLRHSSSELAIELAEPRLLLSVSLGVDVAHQTAAAAAITTAIQGNLDNLGHVLGGIEQAASNFQHALPLMTGAAGAPVTLSNLTDALSTTHDKLFDLDAKFHDGVVTPLLGLTDFSTIHDTGALATALENALKFLEAEKVDEVLCLGDVIGYNADPSECIKLIREKCSHVISGNHERMVLGAG